MNAHRANYSGRVIAAVLISTLAVTLSVAVLAQHAVREVDADAVAQQQTFVARGIRREIDNLPEEQRAVTIWDDAVGMVRARDVDWLDDNLGVWMQTFYGHDLSYVLGPDDQPIYGAVDARRMPEPTLANIDPQLLSLADKARIGMAEIQATAADPAEALSAFSLSEGLTLNGQSALASIVPILPSTSAVSQPDGSEYLHIAVQMLDARLAARIADSYSLHEAAFAPAIRDAGSTSYPVTDAEGMPVAWFVWTPDRPGLRLVEKMAPAATFFGIFCLGVILGLIALLRISSRHLEQSEAEARYLANHDALAGLPNRTHFDERLSLALEAEQAGGPTVTLLSVDIDHFKSVNDTMGHAAGDELIQQVSSRMLGHVRQTDTVARLGGDEFGIVLVGMGDGESLASFCAGLIHVLSRPYQLKSGQTHVTASVGVAEGRIVHGSIEVIQRAADAALYRAKADGRGRYCIFTAEMDDVLRRRHEIETNLRAALLSGDQLEVAYQPIFNQDGSLFGAEALARWPGSPRGPVSPELFIAIAEDCGLIEPLGLWVLQEACTFAASADLPRISVNVSAVQLRSADFAAQVLAVLHATGLAPARLELELTERTALDSGATTHRNLKELRAAGVSIALDDFATGQSLLQYVRDFEIDVIKIDQSFIHRLGAIDGTDQVVRALVDLGCAMGLEIVAEGIETEHQREALIAMGCHIFQGFLLGKPMSRADFNVFRSEARIPRSRPKVRRRVS